ncbi:MAG: hypothetical protein IPK83_15905 [Planctomycetes bacterium]|nr:hypothetical protein [Planctomycetota bacterium]
MTTPTTTKKRKRPEAPVFEAHANVAFARVRSAFADLLTSVDADPTKPQDVARQFRLNKNLTWKISKIIRESDPGSVGPYVPGKAGLNIFLDSLKKAGAPGRADSRGAEALDEFEKMQDIHAGSRETLEMMLGNMATGAEAQQQLEAQRKLSFRGNSAVWGIRARIQICANFIAPGKDPSFVDLGWLSGLVDFRRLRRDATWAVSSTRKVNDRGELLPLGDIESIDLRFDPETSAPLMGDYCSDPTPELKLEVGADGLMRYKLVEGPIGNTAATTCIMGILGRGFVRRCQVAGDTLGEHITRLYTPAESLIHDLFVHKDLSYALSPSIHLYSQLPIDMPYPTENRNAAQLPLWERIQFLGAKPPVVLTPEYPKYRMMIQSVFDRAGWDPTDFHGFRFTMKYPPIPAVAVFRYPLPEIV